MSIPKVIHYCWFGGNPLSEKVKKCIGSWKRNCPDYEIILWDESNYDIHKNEYIEEAYQAKKWAFVSDYVRLDVVYRYGGVYLDTDVELVKGLDCLLHEKVFFAIEKNNCQIATGLGFGAEKGNTTVKELMEIYDTLSFVKEDGSYNLVACPKYTTDYFVKKGYVVKDDTQRIGESLILASDFFCPMDFETGIVEKTNNTVGIHLYEASWFPESDKHIRQVEMKIRAKFQGKIGRMLCRVYRNSYRLQEYIRKGILLKRIVEKMRK